MSAGRLWSCASSYLFFQLTTVHHSLRVCVSGYQPNDNNNNNNNTPIRHTSNNSYARATDSCLTCLMELLLPPSSSHRCHSSSSSSSSSFSCPLVAVMPFSLTNSFLPSLSLPHHLQPFLLTQASSTSLSYPPLPSHLSPGARMSLRSGTLPVLLLRRIRCPLVHHLRAFSCRPANTKTEPNSRPCPES